MYQTKDNFKGFLMVIMLAQSYSHSCLSRTQEGWLPHMDYPRPPLVTITLSVGKMSLSAQQHRGIGSLEADCEFLEKMPNGDALLVGRSVVRYSSASCYHPDNYVDVEAFCRERPNG